MKTVLCYGDSNTYGHDPIHGGRYPEDVRWTGVLQKGLGPGYRVIEEGCNGRTTVFEDPKEGWKTGLSYLKPCLNTHKPVDLFCMMLGSNDLKDCFGASAGEIAEGAGKLIDVVKEFTLEKQGFVPLMILMSPPEVGEGIEESPFSYAFSRSAVERSGKFPEEYLRVAEERGCVFFDAAKYASPSKEDSLHLGPESHKSLGEALAELILSLEEA